MKINFRRLEVRAVVKMLITFVRGITAWKTMNFKLIRCDILMALKCTCLSFKVFGVTSHKTIISKVNLIFSEMAPIDSL